jgi:peptidyl-prolyl cis-trans isomerase B (cyclophilin B)
MENSVTNLYMKPIIITCVFGLALGLTACSESKEASPDSKSPVSTNKVSVTDTNKVSANTNEVAVIKTSDGEMVIEFWPDAAPKTVENFKTLAKKGYYDGTAFHRIIKGFMIQGGDPNTKNLSAPESYGQGGPGYTVPDEFTDRAHVRGVISMANTGMPNSGGSQFFICLADVSQLNGKYSAFGKLIKGDDVLEKIGNTPVGPSSRGEPSVPQTRVVLESIKIVPADSIK